MVLLAGLPSLCGGTIRSCGQPRWLCSAWAAVIGASRTEKAFLPRRRSFFHHEGRPYGHPVQTCGNHRDRAATALAHALDFLYSFGLFFWRAYDLMTLPTDLSHLDDVPCKKRTSREENS